MFNGATHKVKTALELYDQMLELHPPHERQRAVGVGARGRGLSKMVGSLSAGTALNSPRRGKEQGRGGPPSRREKCHRCQRTRSKRLPSMGSDSRSAALVFTLVDELFPGVGCVEFVNLWKHQVSLSTLAANAMSAVLCRFPASHRGGVKALPPKRSRWNSPHGEARAAYQRVSGTSRCWPDVPEA